ncbi:MAG TPA: lasso RiPP family leader peptide-containing protein [Thermoanaerobaculia bacterium]|nr:lasso RiPP family leader peptide-containing protein [Thermoanaerobaculia bacterium]
MIEMRCDGVKTVEDGGGGRTAAERGPRRPYAPPRLMAHGRLAELTRFGGSQVVDSGVNSLGQSL